MLRTTGFTVYIDFRKLKHPNIVEYYGVSYSDAIDQDHKGYQTPKEITSSSLKFFFEYCDNTLQNIVFKNEKLQCCRYSNVKDRCQSFRYYVTMAEGICDGLAFIHGQKYVHRDLKLSNVLVCIHLYIYEQVYIYIYSTGQNEIKEKIYRKYPYIHTFYIHCLLCCISL